MTRATTKAPTAYVMTEPEAALLAGVRAGEGGACEQLVRQHAPRMLAVARRLLKSDADAQDAVQDAFASAFKSVAAFEGQSSLGTWLHRIAVNACLMRLRQRKSRDEVSIEPLLPTFKPDGHYASRMSDLPERPDEAAARAETRARVRACIDRLPEAYRTVLLLRDIEELDGEETARVLGCTTGTVKVRLHRARQALRTLLLTDLPDGA